MKKPVAINDSWNISDMSDEVTRWNVNKTANLNDAAVAAASTNKFFDNWICAAVVELSNGNRSKVVQVCCSGVIKNCYPIYRSANSWGALLGACHDGILMKSK